jgi:hypothetical protein
MKRRINMIITKDMLPELLYDVLSCMGGSACIVSVCRKFWEKHEKDLIKSGDMFYTWQYDIRWAATTLRKSGRMKDARVSPSGVWEII